MDVDEHPKPATTLEGLSKLPPVFKKNGTVSAGNASVRTVNISCFVNLLFKPFLVIPWLERRPCHTLKWTEARNDVLDMRCYMANVTEKLGMFLCLEAIVLLPKFHLSSPFWQGICDGAAALVLASEEACSKHGLTPLARLVSYGIAGVDPNIMGIGPAPAIRQALKHAKKDLKDMSLVEVQIIS